MKNKYKFFLFFVILFFQPIFSEQKIRNHFALGLSIEETPIPIIRTKFKTYKNFYLDIHIGTFYEEFSNTNFSGITIFGFRQYLNFAPIISKNKTTNFYIGTEFDYVTLQAQKNIFGDGYVLGCYLGVEKYLSIGTSLSIDLGPYYTYLKHKYFDLKEDGLDFVINFILNFYIF